MNSISKLWHKLRDPEYRKAFVASQINIGVPYQIRALAKARGWSQETVGEKCGMPQPRISELMRPGRTKPNLRTLLRVAAGFDCGLLVRFVPFSELARWSNEFDPESFDAKPFADDSLAGSPEERTGPFGEVYSSAKAHRHGVFSGKVIEMTGPVINSPVTSRECSTSSGLQMPPERTNDSLAMVGQREESSSYAGIQ